MQIATGEGKTTIISALAILLALTGKKIDVVTSSPVLAARDAKERESLYSLFGLTVAENSDKNQYICGPKPCY